MKGISFSAPLVPKVLDGSKTQTRRFPLYLKDGTPYCRYKAGDIVYMKETWGTAVCGLDASFKGIHYEAEHPDKNVDWFNELDFTAGRNADIYQKWLTHWYRHADSFCSPLFMPEWASRQKLRIVEVRPLEHVRDISDQDAIDEGINPYLIMEEPLQLASGLILIGRFLALWNSIYGKDQKKCVAANPLVYPIVFERMK